MKKKIKAYKRRDNIAGYVMLAPWLFGFVLMYFLPMLISIYYSFTDYNLLNDAKVIGFDNYVRIFTNDDTFWQALKVTFIYTIFLVPLRLAFALVVAMLLNTKHRGLGLYRTIYYAKKPTIFFKITLPMLTPTIFFNLILQMVNGFRVFTESYVITDGGPLDSTLSYVLYLYRRAFTYFDMGYSCALAWILVIIIAVFTVVLFKTQNNWVYYESGGE